jgi:hypothetical protein
VARRHYWLLAGIAVITLRVAPGPLRAQVAPNLGTAHRFGALGDSGVTGSAGAGTVVNGDVGSFPTATVTNFPPSTVGAGFTLHLTANAIVQQAQADAKTAYDFLAAQGGTPIANALGGTLTPGVYSLGAADLPASTTLTLNGAGLFIFNVASTLTMNVSSVVNGTADPCNVYWRVGTSATLNGTSFLGTVIADASITVGGGSVTGRVLAGTGPTGAVTMPTGSNTIGGCSAPLVAPAISKAFSPTNILPGAVSRLTITVNNTNGSSISLTAALVDTLPAGVVVAAVPNPATTCGGLVTATAGASTVTLANSSTIPAGGCTLAVNVTAPAGAYVNTIPAGGLQTTVGNNAAPASASLTAACPVVSLTPATMPAGVVGVAFSQTVLGAGGTAPYTFAVSAGALPPGLTLTAAGVLAGTPTTAGTTAVTIRGTDANGCAGDIAYSIVIAAAPVPPPVCPVITLAPVPIPNGTVAVAYSVAMSGSGGTAPYSFGVTLGALPAGLTLTGAGVLAGTPTAAGSSTFTIRGTDALGCFAELVSTVVIAAAPPPVCPAITLAPVTLPNGLLGTAYSQPLTAAGGTAPYVYGVTAGTLPAGLTLSTAGQLSGTPSVIGSSSFTVRATDAVGCFTERSYVMAITTAVATMPEIFVMLLALVLGTLGYLHVRRASTAIPVRERRD